MRLSRVSAIAAALAPTVASLAAADAHDTICHGYSASKIHETSHGLEAELHLVGKGCGVYGPDVPKLKLTVEHQSGELRTPRHML